MCSTIKITLNLQKTNKLHVHFILKYLIFVQGTLSESNNFIIIVFGEFHSIALSTFIQRNED